MLACRKWEGWPSAPRPDAVGRLEQPAERRRGARAQCAEVYQRDEHGRGGKEPQAEQEHCMSGRGSRNLHARR
jgi:hypothetical protein